MQNSSPPFAFIHYIQFTSLPYSMVVFQFKGGCVTRYRIQLLCAEERTGIQRFAWIIRWQDYQFQLDNSQLDRIYALSLVYYTQQQYSCSTLSFIQNCSDMSTACHSARKSDTVCEKAGTVFEEEETKGAGLREGYLWGKHHKNIYTYKI